MRDALGSDALPRARTPEHWVVTTKIGDIVGFRAPDLKKGDRVYRSPPQQQDEPVPISGAIPMSQVAARSRAMPDRAAALEAARERGREIFRSLNIEEPPDRQTYPPQQQAEPIAWMVYTQDGKSAYVTDNPTDLNPAHRALPLYTTPQQAEPVQANQCTITPAALACKKPVKQAEPVVLDAKIVHFAKTALHEMPRPATDWHHCAKRVCQAVVANAQQQAEPAVWDPQCPLCGGSRPAALAQQAEPVAWRYKGEPLFDRDRWHDKYEVTTDGLLAKYKDKNAQPLYLDSQQAEPVVDSGNPSY